MLRSRLGRAIGGSLRRCATLLATAVLLAACASTQEADRERDAVAKRFEPVTRDSVIYVYRPDRTNLSTATTLWADGRLIGEFLPGTYFRVIVFAGRTLLHTSGPDTGRIEVATQGNDVSYVEARAIEGESPATVFRVVPAEDAQRAIRACCTLLDVWRPGQLRLYW
ncbi:MAG: hypothetical protein EHM59_09680 [Betaproteobacteria bacterium]|nr:MAG: hypothetical protein EHM59_09680 [Betaproteobacteria bacterium]